jgi:hypothetical protein
VLVEGAPPPAPAAALVTLRAGAPAGAIGRPAEPLWAGSRTYLVRLPRGSARRALGAIARRPGVAGVEPDRTRRALGAPDPLVARQPWLAQIGWTPPPPVGARPLVAVLDTGIDAGAPDLAASVVGAAARSFVPGSPDALVDRQGHGTHVAGILAAEAGNGEGGAGVAAARIIPVKIADRAGEATTSSLVRGIRYAVARSARVINVSFGGEGYSPLEQEAIDDAVSHGALVVAAAGNAGQDGAARQYPGAYRHVLAVGALDGEGLPLAGSVRGPQVAIAAPGSDVLSTAPGPPGVGRYATRTGTSMATAMVSGAAARILARRPGLRADQVWGMLTGSARDVPPAGPDTATGAGALDLAAALVAPPPPPDRAEPDDDPTLASPESPLLGPGALSARAMGSVRAWSDPRDDFLVDLDAGDRIVADLRGPAAADLDLVLWRPGTPAYRPGAGFAGRWVAAASIGPGSQERLRVTAPESGTWALEVRAASGAGRYTLRARRIPGG